jgi:hypothetical protein
LSGASRQASFASRIASYKFACRHITHDIVAWASQSACSPFRAWLGRVVASVVAKALEKDKPISAKLNKAIIEECFFGLMVDQTSSSQPYLFKTPILIDSLTQTLCLFARFSISVCLFLTLVWNDYKGKSVCNCLPTSHVFVWRLNVKTNAAVNLFDNFNGHELRVNGPG